MSNARNLARLVVDSNGDVAAASLDNVPASDDASALTTGTLDAARLPGSGVSASSLTTGTLDPARLPAAIDVNASAPADSLAIDSSGNAGVGVSPTERLTVGGASASTVASFKNTRSADGDFGYINVGPANGGGALFGQTGNATTTSQFAWIGNAGDDVVGGTGIHIYRGTADIKHKGLPAYFARAWGTVEIGTTINASGNVSSVSDIGGSSPSQYLRINLTAAMPDTNFCVVTGFGGFARNYNQYEAVGDSDGFAGHKGTSFFDIDIYGAGSLTNDTDFMFAIFR